MKSTYLLHYRHKFSEDIMSFFAKPNNFDLGETPIENIFISEFMPFANGTYVKVYLMGIKFSKDQNENYTNKSIAKLLNIPISDVWEAWTYWEGLNLINKHFNSAKSDFDVEFISIRDLFLSQNYTIKGQSLDASYKKPVTDTSKLLQKKSNSDFMDICNFAETLLNIPHLSYSDRMKLSDYMDNYYSDKSTIICIMEWAFAERGIKSVNQLKPIFQECIRLNLHSIEDIKNHHSTKDARHNEYKSIMASLGLKFQAPNPGTKTLMDKWLDTYNFSLSDIESIISDLCKKTNNINFNYIDTVFTNLSENNISNFDGYMKAKNNRNADKSKPDFTVKKDNFNNFDSRSRRYTEEELENLLNIK